MCKAAVCGHDPAMNPEQAYGFIRGAGAGDKTHSKSIINQGMLAEFVHNRGFRSVFMNMQVLLLL